VLLAPLYVSGGCMVMRHQSSRDLKERVELIQPSYLLKTNCISISEHPTTLKTFSIQCATLLTAKQASTCRTMLGCVILCHRLITHDQPPLTVCGLMSSSSASDIVLQWHRMATFINTWLKSHDWNKPIMKFDAGAEWTWGQWCNTGIQVSLTSGIYIYIYGIS